MTVTVPANATTATFTISSLGVASSSITNVTATLAGYSTSAPLTVTPASLSSLSLNPNPVGGGASVTGTVTLNGAAPASGANVALSSNSTNAVVPGSVTVPSGSSQATFTITTKIVTKSAIATIKASLGNINQSVDLTINPASLGKVTVSPGTVVGGSTTTVNCTVSLNGLAPTGGITIKLASSNSKAATVPATVKILAGAGSASVPVTHLVVTSVQNVSITATYGTATQSGNLEVDPLMVTSVNMSPSTVAGGSNSTGTITLNAAPKAATVVKLKSSSASVTVPATVTIAAKATTGKFTATTKGVGSQTTANITATLGSSTASGSLTITAPVLVSVTISPSTVKGSSMNPVKGQVTISGIAPTGGLVIQLSSSNSAAASGPSTVTIPAGKSIVGFVVSHKSVTVQTVVTFTATLNSNTASGNLTVTP